MSLLALLLSLLAATAAAQTPSSAGFISIDCGLEGSSYRNSLNGLYYSPDEPYTRTGENRKVSPDTDLSTINGYYATLRSFPDGDRNCYTLGPVQSGSKYRVNAQFLYGNYDGRNRPPTFDLYLGVNLWETITAGEFFRTEIVTVASGDSMQVCLVNTGKGTPFISELDLRPLSFSMYDLVNDTAAAFVLPNYRINYGAERQISFPNDTYDRLWVFKSLGRPINTSENIKLFNEAAYPLPQFVLQTASEALSLNDSLRITDPGSEDQVFYVYMHFAELRILAGNETREFNLYAGNELIYKSYRPAYLQQGGLITLEPGRKGGTTYTIQATSNSTLPPIINGIEMFRYTQMPALPTNQRDAKAVTELRNQLLVGRNWEGDPCVPRQFMWKGLVCGVNASNYAIITSLDLSRSGLGGGIPLSIGNLTNLTSLDLSFNNLTGQIPDYLGSLVSLKTINLEGNNLSGPVPETLLQRVKNKSLELRVTNNQDICRTTDLCSASSPSPKKKNVIIPIAIVLSVIVVITAGGVTAFCILKKRKKQQTPSNNQVPANNSQQDSGNNTPPSAATERIIISESNMFSEADILKITNNLKRPIGQGGFGTVYHGTLDDGTEVAVKLLSKLTGQGEKQFKAEAELLTRVHHKHLVSLLGYCKENMALVYEYLPQGSLADHLSGDSPNTNFLGWGLRLKIALGAAQGLDYLHNGCTPPIIHRDVKPSNFLLTENFEVKIADFGLSRSYGDGRSTYNSTMVAGTPGYLDPECQQTNSFSESSDVYSFGVVLLQLVTGKRPFSHGRTVMHITKEVKTIMETGDINNIADPRMKGDYDVNSVWRIIEIGLSCASFNSHERPTMSDVASQLKECLAIETSREYSSNASMGTLDMHPDYSVENVSPAAR